MPGTDINEKEAEEELVCLLEDPASTRVTVRTDSAEVFEVGGFRGEARLMEHGGKDYCWGGCGSNLGSYIILAVTYHMGVEEGHCVVTVGPAPKVYYHRPFKYGIRSVDHDAERADICIARGPWD